MKHRLVSALLVGGILIAITAVSGCCMCWGQHYERTEDLSAPMADIEQIKVDTSFGNVKITGTDTSYCKVTAKITGQAPTEEEAKQLAEQTQIKFETDGNSLVVKAEKPNLGHNRSVAIAYDIIVPTKTSIDCKTSFGEIGLKNITGDIVANTSFGQINTEKIAGRMQLDTSYGKVDCAEITSSDFSVKSSFGEINVEFTDACPADMKTKIDTSFGKIHVDVPPSFAGDIVVDTSFGNIKTDLPITIKGEIGKTHLTGTVGHGEGKLDLKTSFGNVTIK